MTSTSLAPSSRARSRPSSSARYSATLFVAVPSSCACSSTGSPSGVAMTRCGRRGTGIAACAAVDVDDQLHRGGIMQLPGTGARARRGPSGAVGAMRLARAAAGRRLRGHGDGRAPRVADPRRRRTCRARLASPPVELAPVDDHGDVLIASVVLDELRIQLVGEGPGYHAVDHLAIDVTPRAPIRKRIARDRAHGRQHQSAGRPRRPAFARRSSRSSSASSVPWA